MGHPAFAILRSQNRDSGVRYQLLGLSALFNVLGLRRHIRRANNRGSMDIFDLGPFNSIRELWRSGVRMVGISRISRPWSFLFVMCLAAPLPIRCAIAQNPSTQNASASDSVPAANSDANVSFAALKGLAGTWSGQVTTDPANPDINGPIQVTMSVASRGNVIVHEIAPGGTPEPTMIFVENDRVTLVHYCEAGNRPRLVADKSTNRKSVDFHFADISGSKSPAYLERFTFTVIDADHHTEDWTFMLPDNNRLHAHFDLKRVKEGVPTAAKP